MFQPFTKIKNTSPERIKPIIVIFSRIGIKSSEMGKASLQIIDAIKKLPLAEKLYIIELVFRDIRTETLKIEQEEQQRRAAAALLLSDYQSDKELTAFTALDREDFYEAN
jgi:hypothetical protein